MENFKQMIELKKISKTLKKIEGHAETSMINQHVNEISDSLNYIGDAINVVSDNIREQDHLEGSMNIAEAIDRVSKALRCSFIDLEISKSARDQMLCEALTNIAKAIENKQEK